MNRSLLPFSPPRLLPFASPSLSALPSPAVAPAAPERVLVVVRPDRAASAWALARARAFARARRAELKVLCVLAPREGGRARRDGTMLVRGAERLRDWLVGRGNLGSDGRVIVRVGRNVDVAMEVAREVGATLVVAGADAGRGGHWAGLSRRAGLPVLVARPRRKRTEIVAATDFSDERFPTFQRAARIATPLDGRVVLVHNVDPTGAVFSRQAGLPLPGNTVRALRDMRAERVHDLAKAAPVEAHGLVTSYADPVPAIDEVQRRRDADLVVLGAHAPSPVRRRSKKTAERIVRRVRSSALVLPLYFPTGLSA